MACHKLTLPHNTRVESRALRVPDSQRPNLIENAWKYASRIPQARIESGYEHKQDETVFFVRDNWNKGSTCNAPSVCSNRLRTCTTAANTRQRQRTRLRQPSVPAEGPGLHPRSAFSNRGASQCTTASASRYAEPAMMKTGK